MARLARKNMADMRALEEQAERTNPISGSGATPSMGLSQFRGGRKKKSEARAQGEHLAKHIQSLHGGEFYGDFMEGMGSLHGGFLGALATAAIPLISSLFGKGQMTKEAHDKLVKHMKGGAETGRYEGEGKMKGGMRAVGAGALHIKHDDSDSESEDEVVGAGILSDLGIPIVSDVAGMFGLGEGKKPKRVVGAGDGRRKRAEIVKKVMREKGMKMIDASKYVKEHGLY